MNKKLIFGLLIAVILVAAGIYYLQNRNKTPKSITVESQPNSLGGQLYDQATNPVGESLPDSNPVQDTSANPFSNFTNPFDTK